jgi:two-component system OmpR family response regulator
MASSDNRQQHTRAKPTMLPDADTVDNGPPPAHSLRVYVVEDSPIIRERVIEHIQDCGSGEVVGCAETEDEAMSGILKLRPDAVVLDIQLRVGNGFNVMRRLAVLPAADRPVVIVFSNHASPDFRRRAVSAGAHYFIDKGSEFNHLGDLLGNLGVHPETRH